MAKRLIKMIFRIVFAVLFLSIINNPQSPFSLPYIWNGQFGWQPIFQAGVVGHYQFIFSVFSVLSMFIGIMEYTLGGQTIKYEILDDVLGLAQLSIIRDIPKVEFGFAPAILDRFFPLFRAIILILIILTVISIGVKGFKLWRQSND